MSLAGAWATRSRGHTHRWAPGEITTIDLDAMLSAAWPAPSRRQQRAKHLHDTTNEYRATQCADGAGLSSIHHRYGRRIIHSRRSASDEFAREQSLRLAAGQWISVPPYYRPIPSYQDRYNYFPGTQQFGDDEMRITFMGSNPFPRVSSQAGT